MSQYLQRVYIDPNQDVLTGTPSQYGQRVHIVEILNSDGTPWEPIPAYDELECVSKTNTSGSVVLGSTLTGTLAVYTGGKAPVTIEYQWQRSESNTGGWSGITAWTIQEIDTPTTQTYTTVLADNGNYVRLASKATDDDGAIVYGSGNSIGLMEPEPIIVSNPTYISNGTLLNPPTVYSFESVTPVPATFAGGFGTITVQTRTQEYSGSTASWVNVNNWSNSPVTVSINDSYCEPGTELRAQSRATDATGATKTSNSPAPTVGVVSTIGTLSIVPPNTSAEPEETVLMDALISGTATNAMFIWSIRSGPGTITSSTNFGEQVDVTVDADASHGDSIQVQCDCSDTSASDSPQSVIATIVVQIP